MTRPVADVLAEKMTEITEAFRFIYGSGEITDAVEELVTQAIPACVAALADATTDWPCANYRAPLTCLTAPSSETGRCDFCRAQADATTDTATPEVNPGAPCVRCGWSSLTILCERCDPPAAPVDATLTEPDRATAEWMRWCVARAIAAGDHINELCDCGVPEGESESTDPDDRSIRLPHHFDCPAVTAWTAVERILSRRVSVDRAKVEAAHREEWASYIENWSAAVGPEPPTVEGLIRALRSPHPPFGVARAVLGAPTTTGTEASDG